MYTHIPESLVDEFDRWMEEEYVVIGGAWLY